MSKPKESVSDLLETATQHIVPAPNRIPWDQGWHLPDYRRSARSAIQSISGPVTITGAGLDAWETAVERLLKERAVLDRWDTDELWGVVASMTIAASKHTDVRATLDQFVTRLRTARPTLTLLLIANATWTGEPIAFADIVVGHADDRFVTCVNSAAKGRAQISGSIADDWFTKEVKPRIYGDEPVLPVVVASWSVGQAELAHQAAETQLRSLIELTTLLERDLRAHRVYRRGPTNRPGLRGLTLDRGAVERGLTNEARQELYSRELRLNLDIPGFHSVHWFGSEPFPLGELLAQADLHVSVSSCMANDPLSRRIRVAARWYTEAFYTLDTDDAVLALGVAMDALLSGQGALPGSAMADRFAMLAENPMERKDRVKHYLELYRARSSVAHGGKSRKISQDSFVESYFIAVNWCATRTIALREKFHPDSDSAVDSLYNDLRWGAANWR